MKRIMEIMMKIIRFFFLTYNYNIGYMASQKYVSKRTRFRTGNKGRLRKRWYFNAGANLPFVGKTSVSFGSGKAKRSIAAIARNALAPPQHKIVDAGLAVLHNTVYSLGLTSNIPQGVTDNSREGDTIHLDALKFRIMVTNQDVSSNPQRQKLYRLMIVKCDEDFYSGSDAFGSSIGSSNLFQTSGQPLPNLIVNPKACTVLYDKMLKLTPDFNTAGDAILHYSDIIRFNTKHIYKTGTNYGKHANYYVVFIGFQAGATAGTTNVGTLNWSSDLIFKDSK